MLKHKAVPSIYDERKKANDDAELNALRQEVSSLHEVISVMAKKLGYTVAPMTETDNGSEIFEYIKDDTTEIKMGGYLNPIPWEEGMRIEAGDDEYTETGWYSYQGLPRRCIRSGAPLSFDDPYYWEVI